jgi:ABC-2 type transport system ATP-binding protein
MVEIRNLCFQYHKKQPLFEGLSLDLSPGSIYGLPGKNGAGKTSLLKIISGLVFPLSGTCVVSGHTPSRRKPSFLSRIYFLPEEFQVPPVSVRKYEKLFAPFYPGFDGVYFGEVLAELNLNPGDRLNRLSHGQRKKFLIAFGLGTGCDILLMDEPTNGLDIPGKSAFRRLIAAAIRDDRTVVISTHQIRDVENLIDSIVLLEQGRILFRQPLPEIAARLRFSSHADPAGEKAALYSEKTPLGQKSVLPNKTGEDSPVDLEVLFNAVIDNPRAIGSVFEKEAENEV